MIINKALNKIFVNKNVLNLLLRQSYECNLKFNINIQSSIRYFNSINAILNIPSTNTIKTSYKQNTGEDGFIKRIYNKIIYLFIGKSKYMIAGSLLYTKLDEKVNMQQFFKVCNLPDTFQSWYHVTVLHIWLLSVRLMAEGEEGREVRDALFKALWLDIEERSKKLGGSVASVRRKQTYELQDQFIAAMLSYDESLSGSDQILASALWRTLFAKDCDDPERVECVIHYVRSNLVELEKMNRMELIYNYDFKLKPLLEPAQIRTIN